MKIKYFVLSVAIICCLSLQSYAQNVKFHIHGELKNISPMPKKMYLNEALLVGLIAKAPDSAFVKDGKYDFYGELKANEALGVILSDSLKNPGRLHQALVIVDQGDINVVSQNTLHAITVGGPSATAHHQFDEIQAPTFAEGEAIQKIFTSPEFKTDKKLENETVGRSLKNFGNLLFNMYTYVKDHPGARINSYATLFLMHMPMLSPVGKDTLMTLLLPETQQNALGKNIIAAYIKNKNFMDSLKRASDARKGDEISHLAIGSKAPEFSEQTPDKKMISLASFKGKYVLVDFWASWCGPCRAENPNVVQNYNTYKNKNFTILGVSLDSESTRTAWVNAIAKDGLVWIQVSGLKGWKDDVAKLYDVHAIPQNFLIDPNGVIVGKNLRGKALEAKLAELIK